MTQEFRILSFDTSSNLLHLSLLNGRTPVVEVEVSPANGQRQEVASLLMPELDQSLSKAKWDKRKIDLVVVGVGPGSFTGIRVAVITARTLAQQLGLPLVGISILETMYYGAQVQSPAAIIIATTSNQYFCAAFKATTDNPATSVVQPLCGPSETVLAALESAGVSKSFVDEKTRSAAGFDKAAELPLIKNIATSQAQLAYDRLSCSEFVTAEPDAADKTAASLAETFAWDSVLPLYVRGPSITIKSAKKNNAT